MVADLESLRTDTELASLANLYGGSALSFFTPRACYFFADSTQCRFCSLAGTAREQDSFANRLTPDQIRYAVDAVLAREPGRINQVMIVGGNERNLDRGFANHVALVQAAADAIAAHGLGERISVHLATMPPHDLDRIDALGAVRGVHVMFNLEVWDEDAFERIAPGKHRDYGRTRMMQALARLREAIGQYQAHSILIAGLEPAKSTVEGARALADMGISPIVNAYHSDRHSEDKRVRQDNPRPRPGRTVARRRRHRPDHRPHAGHRLRQATPRCGHGRGPPRRDQRRHRNARVRRRPAAEHPHPPMRRPPTRRPADRRTLDSGADRLRRSGRGQPDAPVSHPRRLGRRPADRGHRLPRRTRRRGPAPARPADRT